ncbi:MAG: nitrite/sulfite reductase [Solirubrobacterales bacterium]|nr:nitrite/sulfite reductase [Solirubrobacterales bacterium]MCB8971250.1 nitrite/sulfite reductase [Thermoleophilales bacterium]MCO5325895.1 nitrite/sulfite reductase [Solirubrobacterales bacterium]
MEPSSAPAKPKATEADLDQDKDKVQKGKGPLGSRENPEVYENVPGHIIPILDDEFDDFDTEADKFLDGQTPEDQFIGFRLKQGVYGQRQPDVQMVRVKLPFGGVTPDQMDAFATVVERHAPLNKGHITTRQNVQIHHVPLSQMKELIREISSVGLSSREGCGNTVRNVTGDPWAGVCEDETFDPTPYVTAYVRYFVRHPTTQLMPRKIKTAFSASDADRAIVGIHDIGFVPVIRDGVRGFRMVVGGGTSIMPRVAPTLAEFVTADDGEYIKFTEAALRIFDRQEWLRVNRARARIKVLVDKIGIEGFREMVARELEGDWASERDFSIDHLAFAADEEATAPEPPANPGSPNGDSSEFDAWRADSVQAQRQEGFSTVLVRVIRGDLTPEQFRGLAQVMRDYSGGNARTTVDQNFVLRWVRDEALYDVYAALRELGLADSGAATIGDVVSCPGTDSCKLGITASMGLNRALQERVESMGITDPLTRRIHLKMSGCPNGCSQHHIGNIGFYGASIKVGGHTMPAYIPHIGGNFEDGDVVYGARLKVRLPAKRVPDAVEAWLRMYEAERNEGEEFNDFAGRVGTGRFEEEVREIALPAEFKLDNILQFIDWSRRDPYKVERGEGECAI